MNTNIFNKCILQTSRSILVVRMTHGFLLSQSGRISREAEAWSMEDACEVCTEKTSLSPLPFFINNSGEKSLFYFAFWDGTSGFHFSSLKPNVLVLRLIPFSKVESILSSNHLVCIGTWGKQSWKFKMKRQNSVIRRMIRIPSCKYTGLQYRAILLGCGHCPQGLSTVLKLLI